MHSYNFHRKLIGEKKFSGTRAEFSGDPHGRCRRRRRRRRPCLRRHGRRSRAVPSLYPFSNDFGERSPPHLRSSGKLLVGYRKRSSVGASSTPHHVAASPPSPPPLRQPTVLRLYRSTSIVTQSTRLAAATSALSFAFPPPIRFPASIRSRTRPQLRG